MLIGDGEQRWSLAVAWLLPSKLAGPSRGRGAEAAVGSVAWGLLPTGPAWLVARGPGEAGEQPLFPGVRQMREVGARVWVPPEKPRNCKCSSGSCPEVLLALGCGSDGPLGDAGPACSPQVCAFSPGARPPGRGGTKGGARPPRPGNHRPPPGGAGLLSRELCLGFVDIQVESFVVATKGRRNTFQTNAK